jgi:F-type H+-transporting ATPase subunit epsilon
MFLKISSAQKKIFEWAIQKITVPTEAGEITLLPNHEPLSTVVRGGLVKIVPMSLPEATHDFIERNGVIIISVSKWLLLVDGENVLITTSVATSSLQETEEILETMKRQLEADLKHIRTQWTVEDIEKVVMNLEKISADLKLIKFQSST